LAGYSSSDYDEDFDDLSENEDSQEDSNDKDFSRGSNADYLEALYDPENDGYQPDYSSYSENNAQAKLQEEEKAIPPTDKDTASNPLSNNETSSINETGINKTDINASSTDELNTTVINESSYNKTNTNRTEELPCYHRIINSDQIFIDQFAGSIDPAGECERSCDENPLQLQCYPYSNKVYRLPSLCRIIAAIQDQDENSHDLKELKLLGLKLNHSEYLANYDSNTIVINRQLDNSTSYYKNDFFFTYMPAVIITAHILLVLKHRWVHGWGWDKYWNMPVFWDMVKDKCLREKHKIAGTYYFPMFPTLREKIIEENRKTDLLLAELDAEFGKEEWYYNRQT
jgi:hypothetical protein